VARSVLAAGCEGANDCFVGMRERYRYLLDVGLSRLEDWTLVVRDASSSHGEAPVMPATCPHCGKQWPSARYGFCASCFEPLDGSRAWVLQPPAERMGWNDPAPSNAGWWIGVLLFAAGVVGLSTAIAHPYFEPLRGHGLHMAGLAACMFSMFLGLWLCRRGYRGKH
jgi:hypothetical protein